MDTTTPAVSPLRQRMTEDMRMRKLEPRTQEAYIRAVRKLAVFLKRAPDTATVEACVISSCTWWTPAPPPSRSTRR